MSALLEHRHQNYPVGQVRNRCVTHVGIVGENDVAFLNLIVIGLEKWANERAELAYHHFAVSIGDHGKAVTLLSYAWRHGGAEQDRIHFLARIAQCILNDVDGDPIDVYGV